MEHEKSKSNTQLWYAGYGSNLYHERFIHYITGGKFRLGGSYLKGCSDKTPPKENKPIKIPHCLFFAKRSPSWEGAGIAFISLKLESNKNNYTYGRMWKITQEQFLEIWKQEGKSWYNKKLGLGQDDGIPIFTITSSDELEFHKPSDKYLETIVIGLKETFYHDNETILKYLMEKPGIKNNFTRDKLMEIISSN